MYHFFWICTEQCGNYRILREIKVASFKICRFNTFRNTEFWFSWTFALFEGWNWPRNQISESPICQKVKLECQNNPKLFTMCWGKHENDEKYFHKSYTWHKNVSTLKIWKKMITNQKNYESLFPALSSPQKISCVLGMRSKLVCLGKNGEVELESNRCTSNWNSVASTQNSSSEASFL